MLARAGFDVTLADLDSYTLKFAEFRLKKHKVPYKVWKTDTEFMPPESKYDFIVACDVFEHMDEPDLLQTIDKMLRLKKKTTDIIMTAPFGKSESRPMHKDKTDKIQSAIENLLKKEA